MPTPKPSPQISDRRRLLEVAAIIAVAAGRLLFMLELGWRIPFILIVTLGWGAYVYWRIRQAPNMKSYWGLTLTGFRASFTALLPIALACATVFLAFGYYFETQVLDWTIIIILLTYPLWGAVQQFLALGVFARNLKDGWGGRAKDWQVIVATGLLFGLIHYPFPVLMAATTVLGLTYSWLYLRGYNLLAMGIYHGWLGGLFFYTVLGRNPFLEALG